MVQGIIAPQCPKMRLFVLWVITDLAIHLPLYHALVEISVKLEAKNAFLVPQVLSALIHHPLQSVVSDPIVLKVQLRRLYVAPATFAVLTQLWSNHAIAAHIVQRRQQLNNHAQPLNIAPTLVSHYPAHLGNSVPVAQ